MWGGSSQNSKGWNGGKEWRNGNGKGRMNGYNFPMFIYDYTSNVTPHHVQPQEWEVIFHVCMICQNILYCHV